jgi:DNA-binding response OmpR family regulator
VREILLIHDDREGREARCNILEASGYRVTTRQRSEECLQILAERRPTLVILDVLLHGINGFDLCREIRKEIPAEEMPIIISSELYRGDIYEDEAKAAGAQLYVQRPIPLQDLLEQVNSLIRNWEGRGCDVEAA